MNHLESTFRGKNSLWRYILMIVIVLVVSNTIGAIPLLIAIAIKSATNPQIFSLISANPNNYSVLGLEPNTLLILMLFPFLAGLPAFILFIKPLNSRKIKIVINGTQKIRWDHFFISAGIWIVLSALYLFGYLKIDPTNFVLNNRTISLE